MDLKELSQFETNKGPEINQERALSDKETYSRKNSQQVYEFIDDIKTVNTDLELQDPFGNQNVFENTLSNHMNNEITSISNQMDP